MPGIKQDQLNDVRNPIDIPNSKQKETKLTWKRGENYESCIWQVLAVILVALVVSMYYSVVWGFSVS